MSFFSFRRGDRDGDVCVSGARVCKKRDVRARCFRRISCDRFRSESPGNWLVNRVS